MCLLWTDYVRIPIIKTNFHLLSPPWNDFKCAGVHLKKIARIWNLYLTKETLKIFPGFAISKAVPRIPRSYMSTRRRGHTWGGISLFDGVDIRATGGLSRFVTSPKRHQNHVRRLRVERPSVASRPKSEYRVSKKADSRTPARASLPRGRQYSEQLINTWRTSAAKSSTDSYALSARFFLMVPKSMGLCTKWRYSGFWKR